MQNALLQYWQPFTWVVPALCSLFLLGALWDAEHKVVLGHFLRPFWTSMVRPRHYLSSTQALGLNMKWAGVINSLTPQLPLKILLSDLLVGEEGFGNAKPLLRLV